MITIILYIHVYVYISKHQTLIEIFDLSHYVNISMLIKLCHVSVMNSYIISISFMNSTYKFLILYKRQIRMHNKRILSTVNINIEKQANVVVINLPQVSPIFTIF